MGLFQTICLTFIVLSTYNIVLKIISMLNEEKKRVKAGYPSFSDFDYYHVIVPFITGTVTMVALIILPSYYYEGMIEPSITMVGVWATIVLFIYVVACLFGTLVLSIIQAQVNKKRD